MGGCDGLVAAFWFRKVIPRHRHGHAKLGYGGIVGTSALVKFQPDGMTLSVV